MQLRMAMDSSPKTHVSRTLPSRRNTRQSCSLSMQTRLSSNGATLMLTKTPSILARIASSTETTTSRARWTSFSATRWMCCKTASSWPESPQAVSPTWSQPRVESTNTRTQGSQSRAVMCSRAPISSPSRARSSRISAGLGRRTTGLW